MYVVAQRQEAERKEQQVFVEQERSNTISMSGVLSGQKYAGDRFSRFVYVRIAVLADVALVRHALGGGSERQPFVMAGLGHAVLAICDPATNYVARPSF